MTPARLRERALRDLELAVAHYADTAPHMARPFAQAFKTARQHIERFASTGSLRYSEQSKPMPLRFWLFDRFPYAIFYFDRGDHIDIVRVLHQSSDIPAQLTKISSDPSP